MTLARYAIAQAVIAGGVATTITPEPGTAFPNTPPIIEHVDYVQAVINGVSIPITSLSISLRAVEQSSARLSVPGFDHYEQLIGVIGELMTISVGRIVNGVAQPAIDIIEATLQSPVGSTKEPNNASVSLSLQDELSWTAKEIDLSAISSRDYSDNGVQLSAPVEWSVRPGDTVNYRDTKTVMREVDYNVNPLFVGMTLGQGLREQFTL